MPSSQNRFIKIHDKIFSIALACCLEIREALSPKNEKLILFEIFLYILCRLDVAMVRNGLQGELRLELMRPVWRGMDAFFSDCIDEISIGEAFDDRMDQYAEIRREKSGGEAITVLHYLLIQLLLHAEQNYYIFKWRMFRDPLDNRLLLYVALTDILTELEINKIIPFEAECSEIFKSISDS